MTDRRRGGTNIILPGSLYQRGQIYTWSAEKKSKLVKELNLHAIVNLWPKVDPDLSSLDIDWFCQLFCHRSEDTLQENVIQMAKFSADYLRTPNSSLLVLCEAGKTRSVFFCTLVVAFLNHMTFTEAREHVLKAVPSAELKRFMDDWIDSRSGIIAS